MIALKITHNADEGSGNTNVGIGNENSNNDITKTSSTTTVDSTGSTSNAEGEETGPSGIGSNTIEIAFKKINFYQPNSNFWFINDQKKRIHSTIRIKIPKNEYLPPWFTRLRDCWEAEFQELNSIM
ncbi:unnamed protein product [[Candida] boidinii]|nr:unnamed protein product [[Candida] boidinii]